LPFTCIPSMITETRKPGLSPAQVAEDLARRKTGAVVEKTNDGLQRGSGAKWVFGADTIVVLDGEIIGKAIDRDDATAMLEKLSGRRHEVITAMALYSAYTKRTDCRSVSCEVEFAPLTAAEIRWYLDTGEWVGAAGSYQLQGAGGCFIKSVYGSPSNVVGLPLREFYAILRDNGYPYGG
ncbi:MAG: Maf family protein, partial [Treponema sp.]|nr:Maf family protein [Treponema sp.]